MKIQTLTLLAVLAVAFQARAEEAPDAQMTFKVIDDTGKPLSGVEVGMATFIRHKPGPNFGSDVSDGPRAKTDEKGVVTLAYPSMTGEFGYGISQTPGCYYDQGGRYRFTTNKGGKWLPWNPMVEIVLKRILNPVAGYLKRVNLGMPAFGTPVGYDLMVGDWVAPNGKGSISDFVMTAVRDHRGELDFDYQLTISFSNKGDGIQPFQAPYYKGSLFKSPRFAPEDAYLTEWVQVRKRRPGQPEETNYDVQNNYFFRVRTVLDEKGKIKSALYGKIYGDFMSFAYYLNPTPNDRNMEFNPQKNLFENLKSFEKPQDP